MNLAQVYKEEKDTLALSFLSPSFHTRNRILMTIRDFETCSRSVRILHFNFNVCWFETTKSLKKEREREGFDERVSKRMINYHGKGRDERVSLASLTRYRRWFRQNYFSYGDLRERYCFLLDNLLFLNIFEQVGVSYCSFHCIIFSFYRYLNYHRLVIKFEIFSNLICYNFFATQIFFT